MIVIYGRDSCIFCEKAKKLCQDYNLRYEYLDVMSRPELIEEFKQKFPGVRTVPQIVWDGRHIGGYAELAAEIENTIGGYGEGQC